MRIAAIAAGLAALTSAGCAQAQPQNQAKAAPAIDAVVSLFDHYQVVGLADLHEAKEPWAFYTALVSDPAFRAKVDDVTFECGNARHQSILDRYTSGQDVSQAELQRVWRENTFGGVMCDSPVIARFLAAVREGNKGKPADQQLRVLAIDPAVDWSANPTAQELSRREASMVRVIETEVYAKQRKALFLVGGSHLEKPAIAASIGPAPMAMAAVAGPTAAPPPPPPPPPGAGPMERKRGMDGQLLPLPGADGPTVRTFGGPGGPGAPAGAPAGMPPPPPPPPGAGPVERKRGLDGQLLPAPGAAPMVRTMPGAGAPAGAAQGPGGPALAATSSMGGGSAMSGLERAHPGTTYSIATYQGVADQTARFEAWAATQKAPWIATVKDSWLGDLHPTSENMMMGPDGSPMRPPTPALRETVDALLFVSSRKSLTKETGALNCQDPAVTALLNKRDAAKGVRAGSMFSASAACAVKAGTEPFFKD